jgi:sulfate adenylyltransferase subunit 2
MKDAHASETTVLTAQPPTRALTSLERLESEAIFIIREALAEARNPVVLFSGGKDSTVLAALVQRAFSPGAPPMPLLHIDSTFEFPETLAFRDQLAADWGFDLIVRRNEQGVAAGINPFVHGSAAYTDIMRTQPLKRALDEGGYDVILGGARRDEEKSRAKERVFSVRSQNHVWEPRLQRPELWKLYNGRLSPGHSVRVFPLSNWTEADIWNYVLYRGLPLAPLYFASERTTVVRDRALLVLPEPSTFAFRSGETPVPRKVRFRTVGCWPVTAAILSEAETLPQVILEIFASARSEREGRLIDTDDGGSLELKKRQGYF